MSNVDADTPFLGVLMLDTAFPRILGDAGNAASYPFPVRISIVDGAGALDIVKPGGPNDDLLEGFIEAARQLEEEGAIGLISTCGFLVHFQSRLAQAVNVPIIMSGLSLFPLLRSAVGNRPIGVLTASTASLTSGALDAAQIDPDQVHVAGFEGCPAFADTILTSEATPSQAFDAEAIEAYAVQNARKLIGQYPNIGCILLECGNLPPYAPAIRDATGLPVFSIMDAAHMFWSASEGQLLRAQ